MTKELKRQGEIEAAGEVLDSTISSRLKSGDQEAFRYLFTGIKPPLFLFVKKMIESEVEAEDICQETFATLWLKRAEIDETKNIRSYIFGIAKRKAWSHLRERKRSDMLFAEGDFDLDDSLSPDAIIQLKETRLLTEYVVGKLPERTRKIYELHFLDGLSYEQIADKTGTNTSNVKSRIYEARKKIRWMVDKMVMAFCGMSWWSIMWMMGGKYL